MKRRFFPACAAGSPDVSKVKMMRMDLMELFCLVPEKPLRPPDGQDAARMVYSSEVFTGQQ
jgi:hypothetical protein